MWEGSFGELFMPSILKRGVDIGSWFDRFLESSRALFTPKPKIRVEYSSDKKIPRDDHEYNAAKKENQETIDTILDKISRSGYDSFNEKRKGDPFQSNWK